ncbi:hypothetical protein AK812_SmicGene14271 [Symbiodinium microadriaticum]|uniref:Uncharacterized protein n=1 Tax=Symbiodinium microadriaticum TaxID=2951 RepID=A0A1Q9E5Z4_SYMMI|nr:hypothetical protein AK812_SmicGene14271 [Symbiodinium microadriaticum]
MTLPTDAPAAPIAAPMEQDPTEIDEMNYFANYWPSSASLQSTEAPPEAEDRASKQARHDMVQDKGKGNPASKGKGQQQGQQRRAGGNGNQGHGNGGNSGWKRQWPSWGKHSQQDSYSMDMEQMAQEIHRLRDNVYQLQRLALRQEDFISCIRAELSWVVFLRLDMKANIVQPLFATQKAWREKKLQDPSSLTNPMRVSLIHCLLQELHARAGQLTEPGDFKDQMVSLKWVKAEPLQWCYIKWNPEKKAHEVDETKEPKDHSRVMAAICSLQTLIKVPGALARFHPTRPIEETMAGRNLTFILQLAVNIQAAHAIRDQLAELMGSSVLQLIGMNTRPDRQGRSILANLVQKGSSDSSGELLK